MCAHPHVQYGDPTVRRAVPLAIGLLHTGNPDVLVMDTLSRLSHDQDAETANNAIVGLGFLGAGERESGGEERGRGGEEREWRECDKGKGGDGLGE